MFWRELKGPESVLKTLVEVAKRLLEDSPSISMTVYIVDAWLRAAATKPNSKPTIFHFEDGKVSLPVQVFHSDISRSEPPAVGDFNALPTRTHGMLCLAIQMPSTHKKLAILQVVSTEELPDHTTSKSMPLPKSLSGTMTSQDCQGSPSGFRDAQLMYLQLVCNIAGGILEQMRDAELKQQALKQMRSCVDVAVAINQAMSLADFEQRTKYHFGNFFAVTTARVLFYDSETDELISSSAQMNQKGITRLRLDKGVVGLCAKKQTLIHVANIAQHPYIDSAADGLLRTGQRVPSGASMLAGPMLVDSSNGPKLVGVVQLLEKRKQKSGMAEVDSDFSTEEQNLFSQLLRVCSAVAYRIYTVQDLTCQVNDVPSGLTRMLAG